MTADDESEADAAGSHPGRGLAIRDRTESDLDECVRLMGEVHRADGYPMRWPADPRRFLGTSKILAAFVATLDGQMVGHVALSVVSPSDAAPQLLGVTSSEPADTDEPGGGAARDREVAATGKVVMISRLFVGTAARGYGAGRALMQRAVQAAHERGEHPLLDVHTANTSAIALYERLGWNFLGTSHAQWGTDQVTIRSYTGPTPGPANPQSEAPPAR